MNDQLSAPSRSSWPIALVIALLACAGLIVGIKQLHRTADTTPVSAPVPVHLGKLTASTTDTRLHRVPIDHDQRMAPNGTVVHPRHTTALFDSPSGHPFAKVRPKEFGPTWLPVIAHAGGWLRVLLPSRPDGSTGWLQASKVRSATTPYQIQVHLATRTLDLFKDDNEIGTWSVAVGAPSTPTPTGRTFLLGQLVDDNQTFSPVILPLGTHSRTLDSFGGGPGTVAIHGWTDPSVFGQAVSHGCIRVPADALDRLRLIPLGTPVLITRT
ncbi:MAG: L,D-transpeptidase family protein [Nocardioidaceae bacterium]|nr:L,D-transpeptidase family protein [Nocardioidaceae bacterium]MCL2611923.1 L,D-transpeptidase family protein [Nocardioidaceae bacterium]